MTLYRFSESPSLLTEGVAFNIGEEVLGTFCLMIFSGNVIRFMGPLTTPLSHLEEALGIFKESLI